ncbi:O-antigen ligase family protein [Planctomicrobium sp. SH664]|uniref:O-antigen ligase family protein n=1 Tax=Planctomicrobium sp. SH664 TaxID=3448125 RepID=UPI003F5B3234
MNMPSAAWGLPFLGLLAVLCFLYWRQGPHRALGIAVVLSFLVPAWVEFSLFGLPLNLRTSIALAGLGLFCVHPAGKLFEKLTLLDLCIGLLVITHWISDVNKGGQPFWTFLRAYGEWAVPYVAGRYAVRSPRDVQFLAAFVVGVTAVLSLWNIVEAVSGTNYFEVVWGNRPTDPFNPRNSVRWGWKRAFGSTHHAIFNGTLILLCLPWTVQLFSQVRAIWQKGLVLLTLPLTLAGLMATISRAPVIAALAIPEIVFAISTVRRAVIAGVILLVAAAGCTLYWERIDDRLLALLGDREFPVPQTVEVDGETVPFTAGRARFYILKIWGPAFLHAGLLGSGTEATAKFPPNVPGIWPGAKTLKILPMVDNAYLLQGLRFGWLGTLAFVLTTIAGIVQFLMWRRIPELQRFGLWMAATLIAYAMVLLTVWMSSDFGFVFLWTIGLSSAVLMDDPAVGARWSPASRQGISRFAPLKG